RRVRESDRVLLVLPKRDGLVGPHIGEREGWIANAELVPDGEVERILHAAGIDARLERGPARLVGSPNLPAPRIDAAPLLDTTDRLMPLLDGPEGTLVAASRGDDRGRLFVLSDPDPLMTFGLLAHEENARFAAALFERLGEGKRTVILDETMH